MTGCGKSAKRTGQDLTARLAIVPLVLEARGLDVTPSLISQIGDIGDDRTADIFRVSMRTKKAMWRWGQMVPVYVPPAGR